MATIQWIMLGDDYININTLWSIIKRSYFLEALNNIIIFLTALWHYALPFIMVIHLYFYLRITAPLLLQFYSL
jgi:hypothetical protein